MFGCSGTQIYNTEVSDEGSGQSWDNDRASWSSVLLRTWKRASQGKVKSLTAITPVPLKCGNLKIKILILEASFFSDMWRDLIWGKRLTLAKRGKMDVLKLNDDDDDHHQQESNGYN